MANLNLPTPIVIAGAGLCLLGGYLLGVVAGPDTPAPAPGPVESYDAGTHHQCLSGDAVADQDGAEDGELCGTWQRAAGSARPHEGDSFRFVSKVSKQKSSPDQVLIFGEVED